MKERSFTIDAIKGYGMLLVIAGHMNYAIIGNTFFSLLYSFHMPLFFFLSGYLFKTKIDIKRSRELYSGLYNNPLAINLFNRC